MSPREIRGKLLGAGVLLFFGLLSSPLIARAQPDISGVWNTTIGHPCEIIQKGNSFKWHIPATGQMGGGVILGNQAWTAWPFGFATGTIITDPSGWAVEIKWSNGVIFTRGPAPGSPPQPPPPGGEVSFSFGPNPARPGAVVWLDLTKPVAYQIRVFLNGMPLPIIGTKGRGYVTVRLPFNVKSGYLEIEYQGRRIRANQPKNFLEIIPIDIGGNWRNQSKGWDYRINQVGDGYNVWWTNAPGGISPNAKKGLGNIFDGNRLIVHWAAKPPSMKKDNQGVVTNVDENGRALRIRWNGGDIWTRP